MPIVSENGFVMVYSVTVPPGSIGVDLLLREARNDDSEEPLRIEVAAVRGAAADLGVVEGDNLLAFGGDYCCRGA